MTNIYKKEAIYSHHIDSIQCYYIHTCAYIFINECVFCLLVYMFTKVDSDLFLNIELRDERRLGHHLLCRQYWAICDVM
jgi:hypothetical protein